MFKITQKRGKVNISLTRGDSAYLTLHVNFNDEEYIPQEGDKIHCQVRTEMNDGSLLFGSRDMDGDGVNPLTWHIVPNDTKDCIVGDYYWDAQIEMANGDVFTFIPASTFTITDEVTMHDDRY